MEVSIVNGILRLLTAACAGGLAIYIEPDITTVVVGSVLGFAAGYFTALRDSLRGK